MASTSKGSSRPGHGERRKRPGPPTIELKATEIAPPPEAETSHPDVMMPPPEAEASRPDAMMPPPEAAASRPDAMMSPPEAEASRPSPAPQAESVATEGAPSEPLWSAGASSALHAAGNQANPYSEAAEPAARHVDPEPPAPASPETPAVAPYLTWPPSRPVMAGAAAAAILLLAAGLWGAGVFSARNSATDALSLRMALIELQLRQLAERPVPAAPDPRPMSDLAARMTAAEQAAGRIGDLPARLAAAEQALRRLDGSVATGLTRLQSFEERVGKIETAPRVAPDPAQDGRIAATDAAVKLLNERLAALETTIRPLAEQARSAAAADQALVARASAAEAAVKSLNDRVAELGRNVEQAAQAARTAQGQANIASREATSAATGADRAVRLAFAATSLRDVVLRGEPFAAELAAVKPLVADPARLGQLEAYAASGVPSAAALARELTALVPAMAAVAAPANRDAGMLDRLQASAERFVRIRPVNETPGADPLSVIARIEARAAAQSIDAARAELANLPADMRAPAQGWIATAEKRAAALAAVQSLARDAVAALAKE